MSVDFYQQHRIVCILLRMHNTFGARARWQNRMQLPEPNQTARVRLAGFNVASAAAAVRM